MTAISPRVSTPFQDSNLFHQRRILHGQDARDDSSIPLPWVGSVKQSGRQHSVRARSRPLLLTSSPLLLTLQLLLLNSIDGQLDNAQQDQPWGTCRLRIEVIPPFSSKPPMLSVFPTTHSPIFPASSPCAALARITASFLPSPYVPLPITGSSQHRATAGRSAT